MSSDTVFIDLPSPKDGSTILMDVPKLTLTWDISKTIQLKNASSKQMEERTILNQVRGVASPGELVVVMGPSGAGKSSLLDIIAGRDKGFTGSVLVNGKKWSKKTKKLSSYILQDDLFYETLTVREHLLFQAELRMGKTFNSSACQQRVDYVLNELGLEKCRDTQIGGIGVRGISGGERKRLSFATEILTNPSILFVDEPTSGLDSFMAESVVSQLQKLAREGRTVIATIHQPSSEVFALFDKLVLLSGGETIYNGLASDAVKYFDGLGYECPTYSNPIDYFMRQIIALDKNSEAAVRVNSLVKSWRTIEPPAQTSSSDSYGDNMEYESSRLGTLGQLVVLSKRNIVRVVRDKLAFQALLGQYIFLALVIGIVYWQLPMSQKAIQSFTGAIFFLITNQFFGGANPEYIAVPMELPIMRREYNAGLYHAHTWFLAKNLSELWVQIVFPIIMIVPVYFMIGFGSSDVTLFFTMYLYMVLMCSSGTGLGYMVSCMAKTAEIAPVLGILFILPGMLFGGLYINVNDVPAYLRWFAFIAPWKYGFRGVARAFWSTIDHIPCDNNATCAATTGTQVLENLGLNEGSMGYDVGFLIWINLMFRLIGITVLWLRIRNKN
ncbi:ATP-binding Cassette (ABC) Superfamily [Thraustotheca clavata]|uniref:ATP-binding Cassette (ABC) Superfamily n=1 Tax=Thraustotheca clavata TaxID=74557 RepID=A0A1W0AA36_9STRA|nr:ATP-binding Cassette (ABC) Superfamily [Thraustotheca clavata]